MHRSVHRIFGRTRATVIGAALLSGAALPAAGLWAGTASAAPTCTVTAGVTTCTFAYTGHATSFQVPVGVTALTVVADGGAGANATSSYIFGGGSGGKGGEYKAALTGVTPGSVLSIFPGGAATGKTGGTNQSGHGGNASTDTHGNAGGGGGASTVALSPFSVSNVLVAAGGGGGAGAENVLVITPANGGNGGGSGNLARGDDGHPTLLNPFRGRGGTPSAGGLNGGTLGCTVSAVSGSQLAGGNGNSGTCTFAGGGGGGGYFGGGGAASISGGGGGGAFPIAPGVTTIHGITITPDTTDHNTNTGNGVVKISYTGQPPTTTTLSSSHDPSFFGLPVTFTATVAPLDGGIFDGHGTVTFRDGIFTIPGCSAATLHHIFGTWRAFCTTSALHVGPNIITATYNGDSHWAGSFSNRVIQLVLRAPTHLTPHIVFNIFQTFTVSGTLTSFGHPVAGAFLTFSTGPFTLCHAFTNSHGIGFCVLGYNQSVLIRQQAGRYRVSYAGSPGYFPSIGFGQAIIHP